MRSSFGARYGPPDVRGPRDHEIAIGARPEIALAAALALPAARDPVVAALFWLRRIPGGELLLREFLGPLGLTPVVSTDRAFIGAGDPCSA